MPCQLIYDGYTRAADCLGLKVVFRPIPQGDWSQETELAKGMTAEAWRARQAELMAARLVSWDATGEGGEAADVTGENVARLPVAVFNRLQDLLLGYTAEGVNQQEEDSKNSEAA